MNDLPERLVEIIHDFRECQGQEKLEYLLYYAESFPGLPDWLEDKKADMDEVPECMTPVSIYGSYGDGGLVYYLDIPEDSPTVRGFGAILLEGINGASPEQVLRIPADFYLQAGLQQVLSSQRLNGMVAILAHMKQLATTFLGRHA